MVEVTMPRLSDSMTEATIVAWLVAEGAEVTRGTPLVEVETDKATVVHEADADGMLLEIVVPAGDSAAIGAVIARVGGDGEQPEPVAPAPQRAAARVEPPARSVEPAARRDGQRVKASPVARRMARELGVELRQLQGSGPGGRIVKLDVQAAARSASDAQAPAAEAAHGEPTQPAGARGETTVEEPTRLQTLVARRMAESKATAPDIALSLTVDMTLAVELRARLKEVADPVPSFNDMVVKAAAIALREHPRVNGAYRDGRFELYERVNVGVAVAAPDALVVPTVFDADRKSLGQISRDVRALAQKVREKSVTPPELAGATFTVSNLGMYGIERFTAIINPPQAAILAVGKLSLRPAVDDGGQVVAREQMELSLICDHRILYGADGAQFLARVKDLLEQPLALAVS